MSSSSAWVQPQAPVRILPPGFNEAVFFHCWTLFCHRTKQHLSVQPLEQFSPPLPGPKPCSCATWALAFPCHLLEQAALPFLPCCSIKWWKSCWWTAAMLPSHFPLEYSFKHLLCQKSWQRLGSWCAGWLPLLWKLLSLFLRTRPICPSQFIKHTLSYIETAKPQGQGSSFLCLFCTMVSTTAVAKYHCGTNKITK